MFTFVFVFCLGVLGAILMFTYVRAGQRTLRTLQIYWKKSKRYDVWIHLREERARLCDELLQMAEDLELPGSVSEDLIIWFKFDTTQTPNYSNITTTQTPNWEEVA